jgi:hypothetical protein
MINDIPSDQNGFFGNDAKVATPMLLLKTVCQREFGLDSTHHGERLKGAGTALLFARTNNAFGFYCNRYLFENFISRRRVLASIPPMLGAWCW